MCQGAIIRPTLVLLLLGIGSCISRPQSSTSLLDRSWGSWESDEQQHNIVRKTVFIVPTVKNCSKGYEWNAAQAKCLRTFKYDETDQFRFTLERLKALYLPELKKIERELGPIHVDVPFNFRSSLENETAEKPMAEEEES